MNKKGFTLVELLTAIIITGILAAMAVPMYEKAIEKSRVVEARTQLAKLLDAKLRAMDAWEISTYTDDLQLKHLDVGFPCDGTGTTCTTKAFKYSIKPSGSVPNGVALNNSVGISANIVNAVCAVRRGGDSQGTALLFLGELTPVQSNRLLCTGAGCDNWGLENKGVTAWCS